MTATTAPAPVPGPRAGDDPAELLRTAHRELASACDPDDHLTRVALHLITCAGDVVSLLSGPGDLPAAREALGAARAAVGAATYAVRHLHDRRAETPTEGNET
jgi:hypothetical protein